MARVKRGTTVRARHKKVLKLAAGYRGRSSKCYRIALQRVEKALQYAYRDRRCRKRDMRALWIEFVVSSKAPLPLSIQGEWCFFCTPFIQPGETFFMPLSFSGERFLMRPVDYRPLIMPCYFIESPRLRYGGRRWRILHRSTIV